MGGGAQQRISKPFLVISVRRLETRVNTVVHNAMDGSTWNRNYYGCTAPCVSTLCVHDITACDQMSQVIPLYICILQAIKYWRWEWPGNKPRCNQGWICVDCCGHKCWCPTSSTSHYSNWVVVSFPKSVLILVSKSIFGILKYIELSLKVPVFVIGEVFVDICKI